MLPTFLPLACPPESSFPRMSPGRACTFLEYKELQLVITTAGRGGIPAPDRSPALPEPGWIHDGGRVTCRVT